VPDEVDRDFLRKLAEWSSNGSPVSSLYIDVDGRKYPRKQDYMIRAEHLCDELRRQAESLARGARSSVAGDATRMHDFLQEMDRGFTRGVALFSCSSLRLWEEVTVPRPLKELAAVAEHPYVLPLEALIETYERFCTVIVDREKARFFLARMGRIAEQTGIADDVPGQHDQGGWSQARYQRHIEDHVARHLKHAAELLLALFKHRGFDHLILAGPEEVIPEFEHGLHDYLKRRVVARMSISMQASTAEVLERSLAVEERLEAERERQVVERLHAEDSAGRQAVIGADRVLRALNDSRVETLVVPFGLSLPGKRCVGCGRLAIDDGRCSVCGGRLEAVPDVVESAVAAALRQGSRIETLSFLDDGEVQKQEIGALLRF
jgi:peptide chain release factor subunit 1